MSGNRRYPFVMSMLLSAPSTLLLATSQLTPALAADHTNLEEGLPVKVEDAFPIEYGKSEVQGVFVYDHFTRKGGQNFFTVEPRLALGLFPGFQATFRAPYEFSSDGSNSGTASMGGLYQLNQGGQVMPTFALSGGLDIPYGSNPTGVETSLKLIAQKGLGSKSENRDLHLNIEWRHNYDPRPDERSDRYGIGVAYAQPFNANTLLIASLGGEQELEKGSNKVLLEFGMRHQVSKELVASAGFGLFRVTGPAEVQSDGFRFVVGFQRSLDSSEPK